MNLPTILLADDDQNDVDLTLMALREGGLVNPVDVVRDGAEALDYLFHRGRFVGHRGAPSFVLLDLKMPKVDGFEVLAAVRGSAELQTLPIVVLSSSRIAQDVDRAYALGANAFVIKPVGFEPFVEAVKAIGRFWAVVNHTEVKS